MQKPNTSPWLLNLFPFLMWSDRVTPKNLRADFLAGLTGAIVVLPQGVAFAAIAGMPPQYGLYAGMIPAIIAALWGSSWHLVSGPTTAASVVLFASLSSYAEPASDQYVQLALTLTLMVGVIQFALGFARLGVLVNFISHAVVIGFTAGAAVLIFANQVKHFLGIHIDRGTEFYEVIHQAVLQVDQINIYVATIGIATLLSGILIRRYLPKVPYMIIAMVVGTLVSMILVSLYGESETAIATVGALPASLPPLSSPSFDWTIIRELMPVALAVTLFALTEAVSIARSIGVKSGQHVSGNQEFIGQGLSNVAGSFFSGYVATGSFNRSGVNYEAGAKTPLSAVMAALMLMLIVLLVAPYAKVLPNAAMAGILFLVAWGLIDVHHIKKIVKTSRSDTAILLTTFLSTLFLDMVFAIFLGVMLSLGLYLKRTSRPKILTRVPDPKLRKRKFNTDPNLIECPQFKIARIDGSLFFGAVAHVRETVRNFYTQNPSQKQILIVMSGVNFVDAEGAEFLEQEAKFRRDVGGHMFLYNVKEAVQSDLTKGGSMQIIGIENLFTSKTEAVTHIVGQYLDASICAKCPHLVFLECEAKKQAE